MRDLLRLCAAICVVLEQTRVRHLGALDIFDVHCGDHFSLLTLTSFSLHLPLRLFHAPAIGDCFIFLAVFSFNIVWVIPLKKICIELDSIRLLIEQRCDDYYYDFDFDFSFDLRAHAIIAQRELCEWLPPLELFEPLALGQNKHRQRETKRERETERGVQKQ